MIAKAIKYFGKDLILICDAKCNKAWGINGRPQKQLSEDENDYEWLADNELPEAPQDPGTYEGGHAKPIYFGDRLNKWCARECERSEKIEWNTEFQLPDFSKRYANFGWRRRNEPNPP